MTHTLKTLPQYWDAVAGGEKNFEVRRDDRGFQKGDELILVRLAETIDANVLKWEDHFEFSNRTFHCLKASGIETLGHLLSCRRIDLLKINHMGKRSVAEVESALHERGLKLGTPVKPEAGRTLTRKITYILTGSQFGIEPGYVVMGLEQL